MEIKLTPKTILSLDNDCFPDYFDESQFENDDHYKANRKFVTEDDIFEESILIWLKNNCKNKYKCMFDHKIKLHGMYHIKTVYERWIDFENSTDAFNFWIYTQ